MSRGIYKKIFFAVCIPIASFFLFGLSNTYAQGDEFLINPEDAVPVDTTPQTYENNPIIRAREDAIAQLPVLLRATDPQNPGQKITLKKFDDKTDPDGKNKGKYFNPDAQDNVVYTLQKDPRDNSYHVDSYETGVGGKTVVQVQTPYDLAESKKRAEQAAALKEEDIKITCPDFLDGVGDWAMCYTANASYHFVLGGANRLFTLTGKAFDFVIDLAVVNMKTTLGLKDKAGSNAINDGWIIFRDIANILFIFVLLYASIRTIIFGTEDTAKTISNVIVVAILINFSMFFTKVVIDVSNTLAVTFYNSIQTYSKEFKDGGPDITTVTGDKAPVSVLSPLLKKALIVSIVQATKDDLKTAEIPLNYAMIIRQSWIGAFLILFLTVIIATMTVMLLIRVVLLGFLIMTSALAFGAYVLPNLREQITDKWWAALIGQSFFAPAFLLLLFISMQFMAAFSNPEPVVLTNILSPAGGAAPAIIQFAMVVILMWVSLHIAKNMADEAGGLSSKITGSLGKMALGFPSIVGGAALGAAKFGSRKVVGGAIGVTGAAARNTVGKLGARIADSRIASKLANNNLGGLATPIGGVGRLLGRGLQRGGDAVATSSMDIRNLPGASSLGNVIGKAGGEGGFRQGIENRAKAVTARAERVSQPTRREAAIATNRKHRVKEYKTILDDMAKDHDIVAHTEAITKNKEKLREAQQKLSTLGRRGVANTSQEWIDTVSNIDTLQTAITNSESAKTLAQNTYVNTKTDGRFVDVTNLKQRIKQYEIRQKAQDGRLSDRHDAEINRYHNSTIAHVTSGFNRSRVSQALRNH